MELSGCRAPIAAMVLLAMCRCSQPDLPVTDIKGGDGTLRLSLSGEPRTLNPSLGPLDEYGLLITQNLFSLTYTFQLRQGVRFHDGQPLTSEDVRAAEYRRAPAILAADLPIAPLSETIPTSVDGRGLRPVPHKDARGLVPEYTFNLIRMPGR